jgi:hypothetical protein
MILATTSGVIGSIYVASASSGSALGLQSLDGLRPRIIELRRLADDDRASADDEDGADVCAAGH